MVDALFEKMRIISDDIVAGKMNLINMTKSLEELKIPQVMVPHDWIVWLDSQVMKLDSTEWWKEVSVVPDYRSLKYGRRFFPMSTQGATPEKKAEWKELTTKVMKSEYPDFKESVHSNHTPLNKTEITNFGVITPKLKFDTPDLKPLIGILRMVGKPDLLCKLTYLVLINYDTCHLMYQSPEIDQLIDEFLQIETWRDIIITGLWYGNYILGHEEELTREGYVAWTPENRCLLKGSQIPRIKWLKHVQQMDLEYNPLVSIARGPVPISQRALFYLGSKRGIVDLETLCERISNVTAGCLRGFEKFGNCALVGSTITECAGDVQLGRDWKEKSELFYKGGDIDIAVNHQSYKEFVDQVYQMSALMSENLGSSVKIEHVPAASGVRFKVTHPKLSRSIEIFRTPKDLLSLVQGFHVPCVKALWNFKDLIMSRSFMTALLTGVCETFDWFSSNKIPLDVVLKNAQRGYSLVLNQKEMQCAEEYIKRGDGPWSYPGLARHKAMTGILSPQNVFFRVDLIPKGVRHGMPICALESPEIESMGSHLQPIGLKHKSLDISQCYATGAGNAMYVKPPPVF